MDLDKSKLIEQLNKCNVNRKCPFCGKENLDINPFLTTPISSEGVGSSSFNTKKIIPTFQLLCPDCGYIANFAIKR